MKFIKNSNYCKIDTQKKTINKINGCIVTDCGNVSLKGNCVECMGLIIKDICQPNQINQYLAHDIFFINATEESLKVINKLLSLNKKIVIILECSNNLLNQEYFKNNILNYSLNKCDLILTQFGKPYIDLIQNYYNKPCYFFGVPIDVKLINKYNSNNKNKNKIHVKSLSLKNEQFNAITNFIVCKKLQEQNKDLIFITTECDEQFKKELNIIETKYQNQTEYWKTLSECYISIDLSTRITWGRYCIDSYSLKTLCINSYSGSSDYIGSNYFNHYDINNIVTFILELLLNKNKYLKIVNENYNNVCKIHYENHINNLKVIPND